MRRQILTARELARVPEIEGLRPDPAPPAYHERHGGALVKAMAGARPLSSSRSKVQWFSTGAVALPCPAHPRRRERSCWIWWSPKGAADWPADIRRTGERYLLRPCPACRQVPLALDQGDDFDRDAHRGEGILNSAGPLGE